MENNLLIAEFLGMVKGVPNDTRWSSDWFDNAGLINGSRNKHLLFDSSWEWLMPVVEKIENRGFEVFINGLSCRITDFGQTDFEIESGEVSSKIEAVYNAVVEFIKWYNQNK